MSRHWTPHWAYLACCVVQGAALLSSAGCSAPAARLRVLSELDSVRESPAVQEAAQSAPQAYANAQRLRLEAERAEKAGDTAGAQILGESALAAYEHAAILARLGRAEQAKAKAESRLAGATAELSELSAQEQRVRAETEALEMKARIARETSPAPELQKGTPEREKARREAGRALLLQARLLCVSARLVEPARTGVAPLLNELEQLEKPAKARPPQGLSPAAPQTNAPPNPTAASSTIEPRAALPQDGAPTKPSPAGYFEQAVKLRASCLSELSQARRAVSLNRPASAEADRLLTELSQAAYLPSRDDRGVAVTLRGAFGKGAELSPEGLSSLQALSRVAAAHPEFPILVVLHSANQPNEGLERQRLVQVQSALQRAGAPSSIDVAWAADAAPLIAPQRAGAAERNQRLEVVFVAKSAS